MCQCPSQYVKHPQGEGESSEWVLRGVSNTHSHLFQSLFSLPLILSISLASFASLNRYQTHITNVFILYWKTCMANDLAATFGVYQCYIMLAYNIPIHLDSHQLWVGQSFASSEPGAVLLFIGKEWELCSWAHSLLSHLLSSHLLSSPLQPRSC